MNSKTYASVYISFFLLVAAGCASNDSVLPTETAIATVKSDSKELPKKKYNVTNAIVAVVNDEIITLHDVSKESQLAIIEAEKKATVSETERSQLRRITLDRLIEKKLTQQKIKELNIHVSEEEIRQAVDDVRKQNNIPSQEALITALSGQGLSFDQYRDQIREQIEKLKLVSMEVRAKVHVGETEILEYYNANLPKYTEQESYRARHIFFKTGAKATSEQIIRSKVTATAVLADAKSGKDFAELAKKFSEDPAARKDGGDLGSFKKGDMQPELENVILAMKPGEISNLVSTSIGFHIIKLEEKMAGIVKPFNTVKAEIEEIIYRKKSEERFSQWAKDLRSKASIEIRDLDGLL